MKDYQYALIGANAMPMVSRMQTCDVNTITILKEYLKEQDDQDILDQENVVE